MSSPSRQTHTPSPSPDLNLAGAVMSPALWEEFLDQLDPQSACELLGILHFPHWLASAANFLLLAQYLGEKYGPGVSVRQALAAELKSGPRAPSHSEETDWWQAIVPHLPELEKMVYSFLIMRGALVRGEWDFAQF
jgi:hypothetical protein